MSFLTMFLLIFLIILIAFALLTYFVLIHKALRHHLYFKSQGITCAPFIPVFGHLSAMPVYEAADRNWDYWRSHVQQYGPVHAIGLANSTSLKINDAHYLKALFRTKNDCYAPSFIARLYLEKHLGEQNLLLLNGAEWSRHRRTINPAFQHQNMREMTALMATEAHRVIDDWLARADAEGGQVTLDLHEEVTVLTFSVIAACAFGAGFSSLPNAPRSLHATIRWIAEKTHWRILHLVGILPLIRLLPLWGKPEMDEKKASMFALVDAVVKDRREGKTGSLKEGQQDLLDLLLNARDESTGKGLTDEEVRDEAMTFVLAGHETTSSAVCNVAYALMTRPGLWEQCLAEVQAVCGDEDPMAEDLSKMPTIEAVCNECLRLYPPAPIISKDVITDHTLTADVPGKKELKLKAGHHVHVDVHVMNRLPELWGEKAEEFDHTRWMGDKKPYSHPFAYLPFSSGTRNCQPAPRTAHN